MTWTGPQMPSSPDQIPVITTCRPTAPTSIPLRGAVLTPRCSTAIQTQERKAHTFALKTPRWDVVKRFGALWKSSAWT